MSAPGKDVASRALEDKRGSDGGGRKEEKDNPKLAEAKNPRFSPVEESSAFEVVSGGGETGGEGGAGGGRDDIATTDQQRLWRKKPAETTWKYNHKQKCISKWSAFFR